VPGSVRVIVHTSMLIAVVGMRVVGQFVMGYTAVRQRLARLLMNRCTRHGKTACDRVEREHGNK